jgi:hypothetical protein
MRPSGLKASAVTVAVWAFQADRSRPVAVVAAGGEDLAAGRERGRPCLGRVTVQRLGLGRPVGMPDPRRRAAGEDHRSAAGDEGHVARDLPAGEDVEPTRPGDIPDLDGLRTAGGRLDGDRQQGFIRGEGQAMTAYRPARARDQDLRPPGRSIEDR